MTPWRSRTRGNPSLRQRARDRQHRVEAAFRDIGLRLGEIAQPDTAFAGASKLRSLAIPLAVPWKRIATINGSAPSPRAWPLRAIPDLRAHPRMAERHRPQLRRRGLDAERLHRRRLVQPAEGQQRAFAPRRMAILRPADRPRSSAPPARRRAPAGAGKRSSDHLCPHRCRWQAAAPARSARDRSPWGTPSVRSPAPGGRPDQRNEPLSITPNTRGSL